MILKALSRNATIGPTSAGLRMTADEFCDHDDWDENYRYELAHGVLVVAPQLLIAKLLAVADRSTQVKQLPK